MSDVCLTLICPPAAEEQLWDFLLLAPDTGIFTSAKIFGHGFNPAHLEIDEQVLGRTRELAFTLLLEANTAETLLTNLRKQMSRIGLRYWMTPVIAAGEIS